jgi:hypothetical protein
MPYFSMSPSHTKTLRAPLTKLSCDNIYSHCARTNKLLCALPTLHTPHTLLLCVCTPWNSKFIAWSCTPTFFRATLKFSPHTRTLTFFRAAPKFSAHTSTPIPFRAVLNFTYHKIFTAHHAFLVCPRMYIHFYAHQFLVNSTAEIGDFGLTFSPIYPRHSTTMKFVQFHPNNTNSTYATSNRCNLTFL